jgi:hypothetical protein
MNKDLEVVKTIKSQTFQYLGYIMQHPKKYSLLQLIIQCKIIEKSNYERPQIP